MTTNPFRRIQLLRFWPIMLVVSFGCLTTLLVALFVRDLEQENLETKYIHLAEDNIFAIQATLAWYLEPLQAVAAFYGASVAINRHEFSTFVKPFLAGRPRIEAIQWIPRVPVEHRLAYEAGVRNEAPAISDFSGFTFTEYDQTKVDEPQFVLAGRRAEYYPIYYQEPLRKEGLPLGFDLGSNPTYLRTLTAASNRAQSVAISYVAFAEKQAQQQFVIQIFYPIYAQGLPADTVQTRTAALVGFVSIILRVDEVIDDTLGHIFPNDIDMAIYEQFALPEQRLLYHNPPLAFMTPANTPATPLPADPQHRESTLPVVKPLTTFTPQWQLVLQPTAAYLALNELWYHWLVWACGLFCTVSLALYLQLMFNRNYAAELMVRERTEQLRQSNEQLQATLQELQYQKTLLECTSEAAQDGILVVSAERKWLFFNQRFVNMWQIPPEIADRRSSAEGIPWVVSQVANPGKSRQNIEELYANPEFRSADEITLKNGAVYERFSAPVQRTDGIIYGRVWYFRDITARKQAEAALQASQQQLQERQQYEKAVVEAELARVRNQLVVNTRLATLGQVSATIAHELRNPLGAVRNAVYYIRRYLVQNQQELVEFLQIIDVEVSTADRIITDLLEMTRSKAPGIQPLDLCAAIQDIWRQIKQQSLVTLHCLVPQEPFWVFADVTQFRQIFTNLMTNAVQAMPGGGDLWISGVYQDGYAVLTVQDSGPGVASEMRESIFEPLFTTKAKGTGLGLALCRQIVERHGGTITLVDSERGARFELRLPDKPSVDFT